MPGLHFACRHHIFELLLASSFTVALKDVSSGPDIQLFVKFKKYWSQIDTSCLESGTKLPRDAEVLPLNIRNDLNKCIKIHLNIIQLERQDYREVLLLVLVFLGENTKDDPIHIKKHRARWMAKIIYSLKIYLLRKQFKLSSKKSTSIFNLFITKY